MILTFFTDAERFAFGQLQGIGIQSTDFLGDDYRNPLVVNGLLDGIDTFLYLIGFDGGDMVDTDGLHHRFDGYPAVTFQVEPGHVDSGMRLVPGHGCGAVVENNQGKVMVVKDRIDQAGDSGMEKSGVADKSDHFFCR